MVASLLLRLLTIDEMTRCLATRRQICWDERGSRPANGRWRTSRIRAIMTLGLRDQALRGV
jgi:hypothetical protein